MIGSRKVVPRLRAHTTEEILDLVPHLLGFHPAESLVVLVIDAGQVVVTARVDLAEVTGAESVEVLLRRIWTRFPAAGAWALAYTADPGNGWSVLRRCEQFLERSPLCRLTLVTGDCWQADGPGGPAGVHDPGHGPLAAAATFHGLPARSARTELEACFDPPAIADFPRLRSVAATATAELARLHPDVWPAELARLVRSHICDGVLDPAVAVRLALLARELAAQETALLLITHPEAARHLALWQAVVNRSLPQCSGDALALAGAAAWIAGEGAVVSICLARLAGQEVNPVLPELLDRVCADVVPPSLWTGLRKRMLSTTSPAVRRAVCRPEGPQGR